MNDSEESSTPATAHWLPSHVRITVHQAKDLHLKNKSGSSEVYVRVESDQGSYFSRSLSKQTAPSWDENIIIPLMSLVSTLHVQVRQKGRFGDKYLGYFPLCPGNFKVSPNSVTNWYKLGAKPGKSSSKLRGDLKLSFQFLSKWSESASRPEGSSSVSGMQHGLLLQRSSSDRKLWNGNGIGPDSDSMLVDEHRQQTSKNKKEILSTLRRSFKKKNKSSGNSRSRGAHKSDEFLFSSGDVSPLPPQILSKRPSTISKTTRAGSMASSGVSRPVSLGVLTDSEDSLDTSSSPLMVRARGRGSDPAILESKNSSSEVGVARERDAISPLSSSASESKRPTEQQFQYYVSKKKRWHVPEAVDSVSTTSSNSDLYGGKTSPIKDDRLSKTPDSTPKFPHSGASTPVTTPFTYRSSVSKSFREPSRDPSRRPGSSPGSRLLEDQAKSSKQPSDELALSSSENQQVMTKTSQSSSSSFKEEKLSEAASSKNKDNTEVMSTSKSQALAAKTPPTKSHPYSRKMDITPRKPSPSVERTKPRILCYENGKNDSSPFSSAATSSPKPNRHAQIKRRSTISSPSNRAKLLPATPVRRKPQEKKPSNDSRHLPSRSAGNSCRNSLLIEEQPSEDVPSKARPSSSSSSSSSKLVNSSQDLSVCGKEGGGDVGRGRLDVTGLGARKNTTPVGSTSSLDGRMGSEPSTPKSKHTFQNSGYEPVSLLPPSLSDYTTRSQTLPLRKKTSKKTPQPEASRRTITATTATTKPSPEKNGIPPAMEKPQSAPPSHGAPPPSNRSSAVPTNTKLLPRESMMSLFPSSQTPPTEKEASPPKDDVDEGKLPKPHSAGVNAVRSDKVPSDKNPKSRVGTESKEISKSFDNLPGKDGYKKRSPNDIALSTRNRKSTGGMKKAISLYQENRKQLMASRGSRGSSSSATDGGVGLPIDTDYDLPEGDSDQVLLIDPGLARGCSSEGNSPLPDRSRETTGSFGSVFISSLKRTSSLLFAGASSRHKTQVAPDNSCDTTDSAPQRNSFHDDLLSVPSGSSSHQKVSAPAILMRTLNQKEASVTTLTDSSSHQTPTTESMPSHDASLDQRHSPNPAGAAALNSGEGQGHHTRHTTASSVESEGFHSMSSEDLVTEDWAALSKEDLVKEVIRSKRKLREKEEELKETREQLFDLKSYLDKILLRVMETNPTILSSTQ